jgi:hypothetical protein
MWGERERGETREEMEKGEKEGSFKESKRGRNGERKLSQGKEEALMGKEKTVREERGRNGEKREEFMEKNR